MICDNYVALSDKNVGRHRLACVAVLAFTAALSIGVPSVHAQTPYKTVSFESLSKWDYNPKEPWDVAPHKAVNTIPKSVSALDGQKVAIFGATMPLDYRSGEVTQFILGVSVDTCAYGATPRINEWISVTMVGGKTALVYGSGEGTVRGTLHVKETVEDGRVVRLYSVDADSIGPR